MESAAVEELERQIQVMQAFTREGKLIEFRLRSGSSQWHPATVLNFPGFDWIDFDYRVAEPKKTITRSEFDTLKETAWRQLKCSCHHGVRVLEKLTELMWEGES